MVVVFLGFHELDITVPSPPTQEFLLGGCLSHAECHFWVTLASPEPQNSRDSYMERFRVPHWGLKWKGQDQGVGKKNETETPRQRLRGPRETE